MEKFLFQLRENKRFICASFFIFYVLGLIAFYSNDSKIYSIIVLCSVFLFFILSFFCKFKKAIPKGFIISLYLIFICGFLNAKLHYVTEDEFSQINYLKNAQLKGVVYSIPKYNSNSKNYKFKFKVNGANLNGKEYKIKRALVMVSIKEGKNKIEYGDTILINGTLTTPASAQNPGQFDYKRFLANKGILKTFYAKNGDFEFIKAPEYKDIKGIEGKIEKIRYLYMCFTRKMYDLRDEVIQEHSKYIKTPRLEVLGGVVFGDEAVNSPDDVKESFINSGLLHLLAASGLNVALILSMWLCVIYFLNIPYRLKIFSGIFIIFLYTIMTGFPPSIVRASVMLLLILAGKLIYREANGISLIFAAGLLILMFKPEYLLDVGFQLSFLVTLGLIVCVPCVSAVLNKYNKSFIKNIRKFPKLVKSFLLAFSPISLVCCILVPFTAQCWAGPLQAYYFNTFSVYSIFANVAVVPFIGIVSFLGFVSTAFCFIPRVSDIILPVFDFILNFIIQIILNISNFFAALPNSIINVPAPAPLMIATFYIIVILFFVSIKFLFKKKIVNYFLIFSILFLGAQYIKIPDNSAEIVFFSVGNADSCLIKTPEKKYILIDTGKYIYTGLSSAKLIILNYLYNNNIKELDTLVLTHYDSDHSGGLIDILEKIKVKNLIMPKLECNSKNSCKIKDYIEENNINYTLPFTGQNISYKDGFELVNFVPHVNGRTDRNDSSTITLIKYKDYKFLFMADAGIEAFYSISNRVPSSITILKSAHHGAKRTVNKNILDKIRPEYSILSTGKNSYGHPAKVTVGALKKYGKVLSTMEYNAIKFKVNEDIKVYSFDRDKMRFIRILQPKSL